MEKKYTSSLTQQDPSSIILTHNNYLSIFIIYVWLEQKHKNTRVKVKSEEKYTVFNISQSSMVTWQKDASVVFHSVC